MVSPNRMRPNKKPMLTIPLNELKGEVIPYYQLMKMVLGDRARIIKGLR